MAGTYFLYNTLLRVGVPLITPFLLYKVVTKKKHRAGLSQKLGRHSFRNTTPSAWFHAVSVGEVIAAVPLIKSFQKKFPDQPVVVSTVTPTGNQVAREKLDNIDQIIYFPFDFKYSLQRALHAINPKVCIILETELWPNFFLELHKKNIPSVIINGRISTRSYKRYRPFSYFMRDIFQNVTYFGMQSSIDSDRIISLGAGKEKVKVSGNIKYEPDIKELTKEELSGILKSLGFNSESPIFMAGSTHIGEDEVVINAYKKALVHFPELKLIIAPRHIERVDRILELLKESGFYPQKKTAITPDRTDGEQNQIVVLDTVGELSKIYAVATIVFVGGSLIPHGGQNILEPAHYKKPPLFGPHMDNFRDISELMIESGGGIRVKNAEEIADKITQLLSNPDERQRAGEEAYNVVLKNKGAISRSLQLIELALQSAEKRA